MALSPLTTASVTVSGPLAPATSFLGPFSAPGAYTAAAPAEPQVPALGVVLSNLAGVTVATLQPISLKLRRELTARPSEAEARVTFADAASPAIEVGSTVLRVYRDGVLRMAGQVTWVNDDADAAGQGGVSLRAEDPLGPLGDRYLGADLSYVQEEQALIAWGLIDAAQQLRGPAFVRQGILAAGKRRDRSYEHGKQVREALQQLSEVDDGPYLRIDPVDEGETLGQLMVLWPSPGPLAPEVSLQYGAGTLANIDSYEVESLPPVNRVLALGSGDGDAQLTAVAEDQASIDQYGCWERVVTHSDVVLQATLDEHARGALQPAPRRSYRLTLNAERAPALWDDFDVGYRLPLYIRSPRLTVDTVVLVTSATVEWEDRRSRERITELVVQEV